MGSLKAYIRIARPHQWIKNFFLFAPLVFSLHLFEPQFLLTETLGFFVFCLLSSVVYIVNDIADRESDRLHPTKRNRPVASGAISIASALVLAGFLLIVVVVLAGGLSRAFQVTGFLYFAINMVYSFWLKKVMLLDVFMIGAGFMLRVLAGAFVIGVEVSPWLVLCTLFVSLFLAVSKRRGELMLVAEGGEYRGRPVLKEYDVTLVDQLLTIAAAGMAISYALYTVAERTVVMFHTENLIFTTIFVLFGIFRYLHVLRRRKTEDNPTFLLVTDSIMLVNIGMWFLCCVLIIYFRDILNWWNAL
jgi:4-hydroxybenzoate polyprenyltransferase